MDLEKKFNAAVGVIQNLPKDGSFQTSNEMKVTDVIGDKTTLLHRLIEHVHSDMERNSKRKPVKLQGLECESRY